MKVSKSLIVVFGLTFLIGYVSVLPTTQVCIFSEVTGNNFVKTNPINDGILTTIRNDSIEYDWEFKRKFEAKIIETGEFHKEDLTGKSGEIWLGLFKNGSDFSIIPTKIKIKDIPNPELFDKKVFTEKKGETIFLIKNIKGLKTGKIQTVFYQNEEDFDEKANLKNGAQITFDFNGESYKLFVENKNSKEEFLSRGSKLILSNDKKEQILTYLKNDCDDCGWSIYWVGDLDNDKKLDFYLDLSEHYNVVDKVLFLSSKAKKSKLVKAVGHLLTVGC
ncbi:MAG: hypothetical protein K1X72_10260 [Pyrinomonadaceae bacterium]|nr:hypothetical protein [Pyrinomonadaceae bacterium]